MSTLETNLIQPSTGTTLTLGASGDTINVAGTAGTGFGKILQVVSTAKTDTYGETISGNTLSTTIVTGLQPSITPASTSNKILVIVTLSLGYASNSTGDSLGFVIKRDSTAIGKGDSSGSRTSLTTATNFSSTFTLENLSMTFLDSPSSTSSLTYGISLFNGSGSSRTCLLNRDDRNDDAAYAARGISTITLMEVAG
jgi:hypothetical protein